MARTTYQEWAAKLSKKERLQKQAETPHTGAKPMRAPLLKQTCLTLSTSANNAHSLS